MITQKFKNYLKLKIKNEEKKEKKEKKENSNILQVNNKTNPLYMAILKRDFSVANLLLKKDANINYEIQEQYNIVNYLISNNRFNLQSLKFIFNYDFNTSR